MPLHVIAAMPAVIELCQSAFVLSLKYCKFSSLFNELLVKVRLNVVMPGILGDG